MLPAQDLLIAACALQAGALVLTVPGAPVPLVPTAGIEKTGATPPAAPAAAAPVAPTVIAATGVPAAPVPAAPASGTAAATPTLPVELVAGLPASASSGVGTRVPGAAVPLEPVTAMVSLGVRVPVPPVPATPERASVTSGLEMATRWRPGCGPGCMRPGPTMRKAGIPESVTSGTSRTSIQSVSPALFVPGAVNTTVAPFEIVPPPAAWNAPFVGSHHRARMEPSIERGSTVIVPECAGGR